MLARPFRAVPMFLFCSALVAQAQITAAITGARVIDGTGTPAHIETVIIRDNRIVAVSDRAEIPAGARIELVDVSAFKGIKFAARGQGSYRVLIDSYGAAQWSFTVSKTRPQL
jgi:hypothetical protein